MESVAPAGVPCAKVRDSRSYCKGFSTAGLMMARMGVAVMSLGSNCVGYCKSQGRAPHVEITVITGLGTSRY